MFGRKFLLLPVKVLRRLDLWRRLTFDGPRGRLADLHGDVCVQRIPLDLQQLVGQGADAVLLHRVLCVLNFVESCGREERHKEDTLEEITYLKRFEKVDFFPKIQKNKKSSVK